MHSYDAAVLRAAATPALAAGAVACAACGVVAGLPGVLGASLATVVTGAVFSLTLWLCSRTRALRPTVVTAVALSGYVLVAVVLAVVLIVAARLPAVAPGAVAAGLVVGSLAWVLAEVRAFGLLRAPSVEPEGWPASSDTPPSTPTARARAAA